MTMNHNSEQIARDKINKLLLQSDWSIQNKNQINSHVGEGLDVQVYQTNSVPAANIQLVGDISSNMLQAKAEQYSRNSISVEEQIADYAATNLKLTEPLRQVVLQRAFSGQLVGEINSDALPVFVIVFLDWHLPAKSNNKYQINP